MQSVHIIADKPSHDARRSLTLIAKVLQTIANKYAAVFVDPTLILSLFHFLFQCKPPQGDM